MARACDVGSQKCLDFYKSKSYLIVIVDWERVYDYVLEPCPAGVGRNTFEFSMGSPPILLGSVPADLTSVYT